MGKNVTMKDIAKALNISTVSVSKALSDKEGVSEEIRRKIRQKAEEMGYRYHAMAGGMREGMNYNIGVLAADRFFSNGAFYANMYGSIVKELAKKNYSGMLEIVAPEQEERCEMPNFITSCKADGVVILGQMNEKYVKELAKMNIPYIFLDFYDENSYVEAIVSDSVYGSYLLTNYLFQMGHREIGFIGDILATSSIMDRYLGYYKSILEHHGVLKEKWVIKDRNIRGYLTDFELPEELPTAFVCNCDETAYLFVEKLNKAGFRVPEDISVVGFDDHIYASLCHPKLTTFRVDMAKMAELAADSVIHAAKEKICCGGRRVVGGNIIVRDSVYNRAGCEKNKPEEKREKAVRKQKKELLSEKAD